MKTHKPKYSVWVNWCLLHNGYQHAFISLWINGRWQNFDTLWSGSTYMELLP